MFESFLESFFSVGEQVVILFVLIAVGLICRFAKIVSDEGSKTLTNLELFIVTPCLLIISFQRTYSVDQLKIIGISVLVGGAFHFISILLAHLLIHDKSASRQAVMRFATVFTNAGFMSLPLQYAILGTDGVFCGAVIVGFFQFLVWSYGVWTMAGQASDFSIRQVVFNPGICGITLAVILFVVRVRLPEIAMKPMTYLADLNTPVAMIIIGYHLGASRIGSIFADRKALFTVALRLLISPLVSLALLWFFGLRNHTIFVATVIAASAPVAAITTMFSVRYDHDPKLSVELVSVSTLLSVITMPLIVGLADFMTK